MRQRDTRGLHHHYHHHHHHYHSRSDDQRGERLIRRAPFPSAPDMLEKVETVDNQSFDLTPLPNRRQAEHGPQSFDLIPLPHQGSATCPKSARLPSLSAPADGMRQGRRGGAPAGDASKISPESSSPGGEPIFAIRRLVRRPAFPSAPAMHGMDHHHQKQQNNNQSRVEAVPKPFESLKFSQGTSDSVASARSDEQWGGRPRAAPQLIFRAPFPSSMETVDNHGPQSFDLTPLPRRGHAEHGPYSFDLLPLPNRGNTTPRHRGTKAEQ